ncbi:hypothetical protein [uncultured Nostoc sp.]|uniref:hypothetical protein n=1 Tax=uncultured Nostoc sp. TaxID=340711 RepID=UPI0035CA4B11
MTYRIKFLAFVIEDINNIFSDSLLDKMRSLVRTFYCRYLTYSGLTQELSETLIPTLREAAAASMRPSLRDATRMR